MTTEALKTTAITNLDATPPVRTTNYGQRLQVLYGNLTATTGKTAGSTYQMIRVPSSATLHSLKVWLDGAVTTFDADITLYYSDQALDGSVAVAGTGAVAAHIFATAVDLHASVAPVEYLLGGNITGAKLGEPLWQMSGLSADPMCFFDIVLLTTSTTSGAPVIDMVAVIGNN